MCLHLQPTRESQAGIDLSSVPIVSALACSIPRTAQCCPFSKHKHTPQMTHERNVTSQTFKKRISKHGFLIPSVVFGPSFRTTVTFLTAFPSSKRLFHEHNYTNDPTFDVIRMAAKIVHLQEWISLQALPCQKETRKISLPPLSISG